MINVTIKTRHTKKTMFDSIKDCALARAMREQVNEALIVNVYDGHLSIKQDGEFRRFSFDNSDSGYNRKTFSLLEEKQINEIKLVLTEDPK
jgi:hypothetical protein